MSEESNAGLRDPGGTPKAFVQICLSHGRKVGELLQSSRVTLLKVGVRCNGKVRTLYVNIFDKPA